MREIPCVERRERAALSATMEAKTIAWIDGILLACVEWVFETLRIADDDTDANIW